MTLTVKTVTGGAGPVLAELVKDPSFLETTDLKIAMTIARGIAERRGNDYMRNLFREQVSDMYDMYVLTNGEYETSETKDDWESGIDDKVEALVEPYEKILSNTFLVSNTVDTRLYQPGKIDEIADAFAKSAWSVMTYDHEAKSTTAKVLSTTGIVASDISELMGDRLIEETQTANHVEETKVMAGSLNETLKKLHLMCGGEFDVADYTDAFDLASDTDDGLAMGAITRIGGDEQDVATLREFRRKNGSNSAAMLCDLLAEAESLPDDDDAPAAPQPDAFLEALDESDEDAELAALMGDVGTPPPAAPQAAPVADNVGAPPPVSKKKVPPPIKAGEGEWGFTVPKEALELLKSNVPDKDQDLGEGVGVSRATFNNYVSGKAKFVADENQLQYLRDLIDKRIENLSNARSMLEG